MTAVTSFVLGALAGAAIGVFIGVSYVIYSIWKNYLDLH